MRGEQCRLALCPAGAHAMEPPQALRLRGKHTREQRGRRRRGCKQKNKLIHTLVYNKRIDSTRARMRQEAGAAVRAQRNAPCICSSVCVTLAFFLSFLTWSRACVHARHLAEQLGVDLLAQSHRGQLACVPPPKHKVARCRHCEKGADSRAVGTSTTTASATSSTTGTYDLRRLGLGCVGGCWSCSPRLYTQSRRNGGTSVKV